MLRTSSRFKPRQLTTQTQADAVTEWTATQLLTDRNRRDFWIVLSQPGLPLVSFAFDEAALPLKEAPRVFARQGGFFLSCISQAALSTLLAARPHTTTSSRRILS